MVFRSGIPMAVAVLAVVLLAGTGRAAFAQPDTARPMAEPPAVVPPTVVAPVSGATLAARASAGQVFTLDFADNGDPLPGLGAGEAARGPVGRLFDAVSYWTDYLVTTITRGLTPPSPETFAKSTRSKDPNDFWMLVGDAGYKLKQITTDVGVVPDVGFRFKYVRELSDGDVNWLERKLERHAAKFKDPLSIIQRTIIYTLLNINSSDVYFVDELKVKLLPLPSAEFTLMAWDSGLSEEHDTLLRAIQGNKRTKHKPAEEDSRY